MHRSLSIYVHWPFCLSKCPYCDFNSHVLSQVDHMMWLKSYEREFDYFENIISGKYIKSIFFGGGTPSLMEPFVVEGVIRKIAQLGYVNNQTEITLETNPTSFETGKFQSFSLAGINRVSIGVQSLNEDDLKNLGREHSVNQAIKTIETAATLFPRISFDLIYARSGQTLKDWQGELQNAMQLAKGHISLYQLTIEKGTLFYKLFNEGSLILPDSDQAADMYEWTNLYLESQGYSRYEISNYAILNHECTHNLAYWHYDDYLGVGPGAHSRITDNSVTNSIMMWHKPDKWLQSVSDSGCGIQSIKKLSKHEVIEEILMMGLRLKDGININDLEQKTDTKLPELLDIKMVEYYRTLGLVELGDNIRFTNKGLMLHSYLVPRVIKGYEKIDI